MTDYERYNTEKEIALSASDLIKTKVDNAILIYLSEYPKVTSIEVKAQRHPDGFKVITAIS